MDRDEVLPLIFIVPLAVLTLLLGYWGISVALHAFDPAYYDNTDAAYFLFGGLLLALAAAPGSMVFLMVRTSGVRILRIALPLAVVLTVLAQVGIEELSRRGAEEHIRERERHRSFPPVVVSPTGTFPPGPLPPTPSIGAPR